MPPIPWATNRATPTSRHTPDAGAVQNSTATAPCVPLFRCLQRGCSPQQGAQRLALEGQPIRISYETIYRFIYAQIARTKDYHWRH